jgi:hypothetical protein
LSEKASPGFKEPGVRTVFLGGTAVTVSLPFDHEVSARN